MKYKYILFDLDGTLTDSKEGITRSVQYALRKYNIVVENLDLLENFIGPPLKDSFMEYYGFSEKQAFQAIEYYRQYFEEKGMFENKVYENIESLLQKLKKLGLNLIVATSKPTAFAEKILRHFNLYTYFDIVIGSNLDGTRGKKGEVIRYIIDKCNIDNSQEVVMVGDRRHDAIGAGENGVDCIGVAYGYGSVEELRNAKATYIVHNVEELFKRIISS
ncbi:HAD family hydrolase [Clostridium sp. Mt-5]|uniref:HAD family hydrolase n=1 Tax=Clostridium moutaii TaxID=3240932 RepID=A0ABV4BQ76_9CLOT